MRAVKSKFSLFEVIIVLVILVLITTVAVFGLGGAGSGETVTKMSDIFSRVFNNASIRAQSFQIQVKVKVKVDEDAPLKCFLEMVRNNPELPTVKIEDETEEQALMRSDRNYNIRLWSGEDVYELPEGIRLTEYESLINDQNEILFHFYPDGEASGPELKVLVGDREFMLSVDRLMGQLVLFENASP